MFHLPEIRFWRNTGACVFVLCLISTIFGTAASTGPIAYHWGERGNPNSFGSTWMLWALLLTFLSFFAHSGLMKSRPGQIPCSKEMASAVSVALMGIFTDANGTMVVYARFPSPAVPFTGVLIIAAILVLCPLTAVIRNKIHTGR